MIWLIGTHGMLGREVAYQLEQNGMDWIGTGRDVDITNPVGLDNFAASHDSSAGQTGNAASVGKVPTKIDWVINCSGYTNVDKAEEEPELAKKINEDGVRNIARTARHIGARLIHISTDYVFDGTGTVPYTEDEKKNPIGVYGKTKSAGEDAVQKEMTQYYILRTSWLYGFEGHNFVYTMTNAMNSRESIKVVNDQKGTPTSASSLASVIIKIINSSVTSHHLFGTSFAIPYGIYNYSGNGEITWFDFAKKIYTLGKKYGRILQECEINPCSTDDYPTPAKRPAYSVLSKAKIQDALHVKIPSWEDSLEKFIKSDRFVLEQI